MTGKNTRRNYLQKKIAENHDPRKWKIGVGAPSHCKDAAVIHEGVPLLRSSTSNVIILLINKIYIERF